MPATINWDRQSLICTVLGYQGDIMAVTCPSISDSPFWVTLNPVKKAYAENFSGFSGGRLDAVFQRYLPKGSSVALENLTVPDQLNDKEVYTFEWAHRVSENTNKVLEGIISANGFYSANKQSVSHLSVWSPRAFDASNEELLSAYYFELKASYEKALDRLQGSNNSEAMKGTPCYMFRAHKDGWVVKTSIPRTYKTVTTSNRKKYLPMSGENLLKEINAFSMEANREFPASGIDDQLTIEIMPFQQYRAGVNFNKKDKVDHLHDYCTICANVNIDKGPMAQGKGNFLAGKGVLFLSESSYSKNDNDFAVKALLPSISKKHVSNHVLSAQGLLLKTHPNLNLFSYEGNQVGGVVKSLKEAEQISIMKERSSLPMSEQYASDSANVYDISINNNKSSSVQKDNQPRSKVDLELSAALNNSHTM